MKSRFRICLAILFALIVLYQVSTSPPQNSASHLKSSTAPAGTPVAVRATESEMRFKQIPWNTNVFEGFQLAKQEDRPIFFYMVSGDPLDDC